VVGVGVARFVAVGVVERLEQSERQRGLRRECQGSQRRTVMRGACG
jgi:hypothetical protein